MGWGEGGHRTGGTGFGGAERGGRVRGCGDTGVHGGTFEENVQNYRLETTNFVTSVPVHVYARVHPSIYIYIYTFTYIYIYMCTGVNPCIYMHGD